MKVVSYNYDVSIEYDHITGISIEKLEDVEEMYCVIMQGNAEGEIYNDVCLGMYPYKWIAEISVQQMYRVMKEGYKYYHFPYVELDPETGDCYTYDHELRKHKLVLVEETTGKQRLVKWE